MSWTLPGHEKLLPVRPWELLQSPCREQMQVAMLACLVERVVRQVVVSNTKSGRAWQVTLHPCRYGKVRIVGISREIPTRVQSLTHRESEVCELLATGKTSKQIAAVLSVARSTVDNLRASAARRLGIQASALLAWSVEHREWL
jgi:DNA-binding CsgD family transcriptional regulator